MRTTVARVKRKIEMYISDGSQNRFEILGAFLCAVSVGYGILVKLRETLYDKGLLPSKTLLCPVVSIGNITLGGSGKTPMTIYLAALITGLGYRVTILCRGYKGKAEKIGGVVSDGRKICMGPDEAGDEPVMIARRLETVPVIVGQDRYKSGKLAIKRFNPDVLLLDDGFQHLRLNRDINLVLLDAQKPFGNTYLFPRGALREKTSALIRGDAVILTRSDVKKPTPLDQIKRLIPEKPIFHSIHNPYIVNIVNGSHSKRGDEPNTSSKHTFAIFKNTRVFAFSGIARNDEFLKTIEHFDCKVSGFSRFPDHHDYTKEELDTIVRLALERSVDFIITTEKDYARIAHKINWPIALAVVGIAIAFNDNAFDAFIIDQLSKLENFTRRTALPSRF